MHGTLRVTGDAHADELLNTDPLPLLIGMLLDQHVAYPRSPAAGCIARRLDARAAGTTGRRL